MYFSNKKNWTKCIFQTKKIWTIVYVGENVLVSGVHR